MAKLTINDHNGLRSCEPRIAEHALAFCAVLELAAEHIKAGRGVADVVQEMALVEVVRSASGRV